MSVTVDEFLIDRTIKQNVPFQHLIKVRSAYTHWAQKPTRARAALRIRAADPNAAPPVTELTIPFEIVLPTIEYGILLKLDADTTASIPEGTYPFDVVIDIDGADIQDYPVKRGYMRVVNPNPDQIAPTYEETFP
jgi:hypothetical protein